MPGRFWWDHARGPLLVFLVLAGVFAFTGLDLVIAGFFFDELPGEWSGAHSWWVNDALHTGGRWAIRVLVFLLVAVAIAATLDRSRRKLRRPSIYLASSIVLSVGTVGLLKVLTNVDCPWDLAPFGGQFPFVPLAGDRPDDLRPAQCFPSAHASSGYALLALYFAFRERSAALARAGLVLGIATGLVFGVAQQSRGAHFLSHDLWSAFVSWIVALTVYTTLFKARLWPRPASQAALTRIASHEATGTNRRGLVPAGAAAVRPGVGGFPGAARGRRA